MFIEQEQIHKVITNNCIAYYNQNKQLHRLDGPAVEWLDSKKYWLKNNKKHRLDGPAVEYNNGYKEWWIEGEKYSEEEYLEKIKKI